MKLACNMRHVSSLIFQYNNQCHKYKNLYFDDIYDGYSLHMFTFRTSSYIYIEINIVII